MHTGAGALVAGLVRGLVGNPDTGDAADAPRLGGAVLDLLAVAFAARLGRTAADESARGALLTRVETFVEERLGDPALSPGMVAAAHHVSLRQLYKLFEADGRSVADWIRHRRLERCRRDLLDPRLRHRPVSAIAARWGFTNAAHFGRVFRATYGSPPAEYRLGHYPKDAGRNA